MQLVHQFINPRDWVLVLYDFLVQILVVYAHSQCSILLLHQNHQRSKGDGTWSKETQVKEFLDGIINLILELIWMFVGMNFYRKCSNFKLNYVLNSMVRWPFMWEVFKKPLMLVQQFFLCLWGGRKHLLKFP